MTEKMDAKVRAGRLGGATTAKRSTPEQIKERGSLGALAGVATRVEKSWDRLPEADKDRIRAVALSR